MNRWLAFAIFQVLNAMLIAALNFKALCPPESARFALVSVLLAGVGVLVGLMKSPTQKDATFLGSVDDIEERQVIKKSSSGGFARIEVLWLLAVSVAAALALGGCALPLQHIQRCDSLHSRAVGWKATAAVTGALSGASIATALGIDGTTGQRVAGASALVLGGMSSLAIFEVGEAEHQYAIECEAPQIPAIVVGAAVLMPSPAP